MAKLEVEQRVRFPPFESHRFIPTQLPIARKVKFLRNGTVEQLQKYVSEEVPSFSMGGSNSWIIEQRYLIDGDYFDDSKLNRKENLLEKAKKPLAVKQQRRGWYLTPNPIHAAVRKFISISVVVLLISLGYLFVEPILASLGIPGIGTGTVRIGLLDYPVLSVIIIPLLFAPLMLRVAANLSDLRQQRFFLKSSPKDPLFILHAEPVAGQPLKFKIEIPELREEWKEMFVTWRVGALPPARHEMFNALDRTHSKQPPPGLTTELPHHWDVGLDDGTAGGEDAPMEDREVKGGLFLRPMRTMEFGGKEKVSSEFIVLEPPKMQWPGTISTDLVRIHWEVILAIEREKQGKLLYVMPIPVHHRKQACRMEEFPTNDGRTESDSF